MIDIGHDELGVATFTHPLFQPILDEYLNGTDIVILNSHAHDVVRADAADPAMIDAYEATLDTVVTKIQERGIPIVYHMGQTSTFLRVPHPIGTMQ